MSPISHQMLFFSVTRGPPLSPWGRGRCYPEQQVRGTWQESGHPPTGQWAVGRERGSRGSTSRDRSLGQGHHRMMQQQAAGQVSSPISRAPNRVRENQAPTQAAATTAAPAGAALPSCRPPCWQPPLPGCSPQGYYLAGVHVALQVASTDHRGRDQVIVDIFAVAFPGLDEGHLGSVQHVRRLPWGGVQRSESGPFPPPDHTAHPVLLPPSHSPAQHGALLRISHPSQQGLRPPVSILESA